MPLTADALLDSFETQWSSHGEPNIIEFADKRGGDSDFHLQLAMIDLEWRVRRAIPSNVCHAEGYAQLLPTLEREQLLALAVEEYRLRGLRDATDFASHLPTLSPDLCETLAALPAAESRNPEYAVQADRVGPYQLLRVLGEGGMGTVYLAQQLKPVERRVAVKLIRRGLGTRTVEARFEAECQAMAMMSHPNIPQVLDIGRTEEDLPYYAMQLVHGPSITEFCKRRSTTLAERLQLFQQLCSAIDHAHRKGIIHRDLKPANILVEVSDDAPVVRVIDFGLVKSNNRRLSDKTICTRVGELLGSLDHMSPEQASMQCVDVDSRSDVYSLGVVLFELLFEHVPLEASRAFSDRTKPTHEILRMIHEDMPRIPKLAFDGNALDGRLSGIVLKAMAKCPDHRFPTASALAEAVADVITSPAVPARNSQARHLKNATQLLGAMSIGVALGLAIGTAFASAPDEPNAADQLGDGAARRNLMAAEPATRSN